ncbi:HTH domain-containing protein [bacterium]|nr:HTH domain-containing protein [bacterium]
MMNYFKNDEEVMRRLERLFALVIHLQPKRFVTARELAEWVWIHLRTVYRDIYAFEDGGIPIDSISVKD